MRSTAFIDRCAITIPVLPQHWETAKDNLSELFNIDSRFTRLAIGSYSTRMRIYIVSVRFSLHGLKSKCSFHIEVLPTKPGINFMRIDWNPTNAKKPDLDALLCLLSVNVPELTGALRQATITRVDISFDVSSPASQFYIATKSAATITTKYKQKNGIDNYYLGAAKSPHKMLCYDKNIEKYGGSVIRTASGAIRYLRSKTRCELRLTRAGKISNIPRFPNSLKRYIFSDYQKLRAVPRTWDWDRFLSRCEISGAQIALRFVSQKQRSSFRRIMKSCEPTWYCEETIWLEAITQLRTLFEDLTILNSENETTLRFSAI